MTQSDFFDMKVHFFVVKTSAKNLLILQKKIIFLETTYQGLSPYQISGLWHILIKENWG